MTDKTALGDRMKEYEHVTRYTLPRRTYTILRVDGRAFHTLLRCAEKPFDYSVIEQMGNVAAALCQDISGAQFAYTQSDECSVLITDFGSVHTEPWFGGNIQKMSSVAASIATCAFNWQGTYAQFDARVFTIPEPVEVANYFLWRQRDAVRNSISMAAQAKFSHKSLQGLNTDQMQEKLFTEKGINWNDYPASAKRGNICWRDPFSDYPNPGQLDRRPAWFVKASPQFQASSGNWLGQMIPPLPSFQEGA